MAQEIVLNAKVQRPSACNAMETLLVDQAVAPQFLPAMAASLLERKVELRLDKASLNLLHAQSPALNPKLLRAATEQDWSTEHLDYILNVRVVGGLGEAIEHINRYGSAHSDCIVTRNEEKARRFLHDVDSAAVYWNASTRFTDGGEFGMGVEIGISMDKVGARGLMGLDELTTYKWIGIGNGQIRT